jgi:hypothetical protein
MGLAWRHLDFQKQIFLASALATNSFNTYRSGVNHYIKFCQFHNLNPLPLVEPILENFCVYLSSKVGYKSIKVYLCGVQHYSKMFCYRERICDMVRLEYVLLGIRRSQGTAHLRPTRPPVTFHLLQIICRYISHTENQHDYHMLTSATLLAFFGLLRVSEYTCPSTSMFDPSVHLSPQDIAFHSERQMASVFIKSSKTDPFRQGVIVRLAVLNHPLCPVKALFRYIAIRGTEQGPLFIYSSGAFLTRIHLADLLCRSLPFVPNVNTHSFRRGGASALAAAGTPEHVIQILGRWKSRAYTEYLQFSDTFISQANENMTREPPR